MDGLSSVCFETATGDQILLAATGFNVDPLRVLFMTEVDYLQAMSSGGEIADKSQAMPILSSDSPTVKLSMPCAGQWRIVYHAGDAESVTVSVVPS